MNLKLKVKGDPLKQLQARAGAHLPKELLDQGGELIRASVADQFAKGRGLTEAGGSKLWAPAKPFGNRPPSTAPLQFSGAYRDAWLGTGAGGRKSSRPSENSVTIGVDNSKFPQVYVFQAPIPTHIKVTPLMRRFLAATYDVHLSGKTTELAIKPRPLGIGKATNTAFGKLVVKWLATGEVG